MLKSQWKRRMKSPTCFWGSCHLSSGFPPVWQVCPYDSSVAGCVCVRLQPGRRPCPAWAGPWATGTPRAPPQVWIHCLQSRKLPYCARTCNINTSSEPLPCLNMRVIVCIGDLRNKFNMLNKELTNRKTTYLWNESWNHLTLTCPWRQAGFGRFV